MQTHLCAIEKINIKDHQRKAAKMAPESIHPKERVGRWLGSISRGKRTTSVRVHSLKEKTQLVVKTSEIIYKSWQMRALDNEDLRGRSWKMCRVWCGSLRNVWLLGERVISWKTPYFLQMCWWRDKRRLKIHKILEQNNTKNQKIKLS